MKGNARTILFSFAWTLYALYISAELLLGTFTFDTAYIVVTAVITGIILVIGFVLKNWKLLIAGMTTPLTQVILLVLGFGLQIFLLIPKTIINMIAMAITGEMVWDPMGA